LGLFLRCLNLRPEGNWIAHQDLLLRSETDLIKLLQIVAADACTGRPTVPIVGKALAVQLEALRFLAVARFVLHLLLILLVEVTTPDTTLIVLAIRMTTLVSLISVVRLRVGLLGLVFSFNLFENALCCQCLVECGCVLSFGGKQSWHETCYDGCLLLVH